MLNRRNMTALLAGTAIAGTLALPAAADWRDGIDVIRIATAASDNQAARRARYEPVAEFLSEKPGESLLEVKSWFRELASEPGLDSVVWGDPMEPAPRCRFSCPPSRTSPIRARATRGMIWASCS